MKLVGIVVAVGGAIELTVTAPHKNSTDSGSDNGNSTGDHHHISMQIMGYISLLLNTFCMVSQCMCVELRHL